MRLGSSQESVSFDAVTKPTRVRKWKRSSTVLVPRTSTGPSTHMEPVPTVPSFETRTT